MDLVAEDQAAVPLDDLTDGFEFGAVEGLPDRIVRVAQHQQPGTGGELAVQSVEVHRPVGIAAQHGHLDPLMAEGARHVDERHVAGRGDDDPRARRQPVGHHDGQAGQHVGQPMDLEPTDLPAVPGSDEFAGRLLELGAPGHRRVSGLLAFEQLLQNLRNLGGDPEIHLGDPGSDGVRVGRPLETAGRSQVVDGQCVDTLSKLAHGSSLAALAWLSVH